MKRSGIYTPAVILLVLLMSTCAPQVFEDAGGAAAGGDGEVEEGVLQLHVPRIAPSLARALGTSPDAGISTQALFIVSRVEFELYLDDVLSDTYTWDDAALLPEGPEGAATVDWTIPAASGYTLQASVYNANVSDTDPVLYGESVTFTVSSGQTTEVWIRPTPDPDGVNTIDPTDIPEVPPGTAASIALTSCYDTGDIDGDGNPIYGWEEEHWFVIDTTGENAVTVTADADAASGVYIAAYDADGNRLTGAISGAMLEDMPVYWEYGGAAELGFLTPGETYYIGLITISNTEDTPVASAVEVGWASLTDIDDEADADENDTLGTADTIAESTVINGVNLDPQDETDTFIGGDWYTFTLAADASESVTIVMEFDQDAGNLDLGLYTWGGSGDPTLVAESTSTTLSGSGSGADPEEERLEETLTPGETYYIRVYSPGDPIGNSYALEWAGEGTVSIGLE